MVVMKCSNVESRIIVIVQDFSIGDSLKLNWSDIMENTTEPPARRIINVVF
jgi:hypothetical protein